jgi:hypothetical protein
MCTRGRPLRIGEQAQIPLLANFHRTQRGEMPGNELAIEQLHPGRAQCRHQPRQRHLRRIGCSRKHAFAAEHPVEPDAVQPTHQFGPAIGSRQPALDRMRMASGMQRTIAGGDALTDPGFAAFGHTRRGTFGDHLGERSIAGHGKPPAPQRTRQRMRTTKTVQRQDRAALRLDPVDIAIDPRIGHRENPAAIGQHKQLRLDDR